MNRRHGDHDGERPQKKKFDYDPNSNFRLYYQNDDQFYKIIIRKEEPPYEFKIHLFLDGERD